MGPMQMGPVKRQLSIPLLCNLLRNISYCV
jgi:hypothetical protein